MTLSKQGIFWVGQCPQSQSWDILLSVSPEDPGCQPNMSPLNMKANTKDQCLYCKFLVHFSQLMKKEVTLEARPRPAFEQFSNCTNVHHFYFPNVQFKGMEEENITAICQPRCLLATRSQWSTQSIKKTMTKRQKDKDKKTKRQQTQSITFIVLKFAREICLFFSDWSIVPVSQWGKSGQGIPQYGSIPS